MRMKYSKSFTNILLVALAVLLMAGCGGAESRKAKYLEKGRAYIAQENYDKAMVELKNVLQIDPKHAEAYYLIGQAEEARQNWQQAFGSYSKAVDLDPSHLDARARLGRIYLVGGDLAKAKEQVDAVLAKQPTHVVAQLLKATIAANEGKTEEAIRQASELIKAMPSEFEAYGLIAAIYLNQKKMDKSIEVLQQGIAANPKNVPLRMNLAQIYSAKGENTKVEELLQECIAIDPRKLEYQITFASFLARTSQFDKAEKILRAAIAQDPKDEQRHLVLVDFLSGARKDTQSAEQALLNAIKENPDSSRLRFVLASLYAHKDDTVPKAMDVYRDVISRYGEKPEGLHARNQLAGLFLQQGNQAETEKLVEEVLKQNPKDNDALLLKARLSLAKRDAQNAIIALRVVLRDQPNNVDAYMQLAAAHVLNKEPDLAKESLQKALELNPKSIRVHLALARFYAQSGDTSMATKKVDETLKLSPSDPDALVVKYELLVAKKDMAGAQTILEKLKAAAPENIFSYDQLAQLYAKQHKYDAAVQEYEKALSKTQNGFVAMTGIVNAYVAQKKPEKALDRLNQALEKDPSSLPYVHELIAEVYIRQKKYDEAERSLRKAIEANPKWNVPYRNLANLYLVRSDFAIASQIYQQGLNAIPEDVPLLLHLAETYERTRDYDKAITTYERILGKNPNNDMAANNLASLLADRKGDAQSLKRAKELAARFESSRQSAFMDTLGWVYYKSGESDKAVVMLEKAVKQAPAVPVFHYHLGMVYYKKGDHQSAKSHLAKAVEAKREYPGMEEARETLKKIP
jgi:tetratricopeptide (TPR) repeat protein